eukprot:178423-Hanusia_phi.AAC.1
MIRPAGLTRDSPGLPAAIRLSDTVLPSVDYPATGTVRSRFPAIGQCRNFPPARRPGPGSVRNAGRRGRGRAPGASLRAGPGAESDSDAESRIPDHRIGPMIRSEESGPATVTVGLREAQAAPDSEGAA